MLKKIIITGILLASSSVGNAEERYYSFEWTGFLGVLEAGPDLGWFPDITFSGTFRGEDGNQDGVIALAEISSLHLDTSPATDLVLGCPASGPGVSGITDCYLTSFRYEIGGGLSFAAGYTGSSDGFINGEFGVTAPQAYYFDNPFRPGTSYHWMSGTTFEITSAVPEPGSWAMLVGGLAMIGTAVRSRTRR